MLLPAPPMRMIAELLRPFMPTTAERLLAMLGQVAAPASWTTLETGRLLPGTTLGETVPLFPRMDLTVEALRQMSQEDSSVPEQPAVLVAAEPGESSPATAPAAAAPAAAAPAAPAQAAELITYEDFMKIDLRVAKVLEA